MHSGVDGFRVLEAFRSLQEAMGKGAAKSRPLHAAGNGMAIPRAILFSLDLLIISRNYPHTFKLCIMSLKGKNLRVVGAQKRTPTIFESTCLRGGHSTFRHE